jgi:hypothetical protein
MIRNLARNVVTILKVTLSALPLLVLFGCPPSGIGGGSSTTGTIGIAYACKAGAATQNDATCSRTISYTLTPGQLTGSSGTTTKYPANGFAQLASGTQPYIPINNNSITAAVFSAEVPTTFAFGTWTLDIKDNTGWEVRSTPITFSTSSAVVEVHCSNTASSCLTGDPSLPTYP